jgi:hypothetical protein
MEIVTVVVPAEAELLEVAKRADAQHLRLLTDGKSTVLSPHAIPGFRPMIVKVKPMREAA